MSWLCQCGNGNLCEDTPPDHCPVCNFPLGEYFDQFMQDGETECDSAGGL